MAQDLVAIHEKFINKISEIDLQRIGPKGDIGRSPTREELLKIIEPLIPEVEDGHTPTEEELLAIITPLVSEAKDGKTPTREELEEIISSLMPEIPTKEEIVKEIKSLIPKEIDIDKIAKLAAALVKLKLPKSVDIEEFLKSKKVEVKDINGLEQTLSALKNQTRQGYLHGGGVPSLSAGSNITLTLKNDGGYTIASTAGAGVWYQDEVPAGSKNGINITFTLAHSPTTVVFLHLNGQYLVSGTDYTRVGTTITMTTAPLSTDVLIATYS